MKLAGGVTQAEERKIKRAPRRRSEISSGRYTDMEVFCEDTGNSSDLLNKFPLEMIMAGTVPVCCTLVYLFHNSSDTFSIPITRRHFGFYFCVVQRTVQKSNRYPTLTQRRQFIGKQNIKLARDSRNECKRTTIKA